MKVRLLRQTLTLLVNAWRDIRYLPIKEKEEVLISRLFWQQVSRKILYSDRLGEIKIWF